MKTINLELKVIEDLFLEPSYNPFDSDGRFQSGIEELMDQVRELSLKEPLTISLTLSSHPESEDINEVAQTLSGVIQDGDVLLTLGAGNIGAVAAGLEEALKA